MNILFIIGTGAAAVAVPLCLFLFACLGRANARAKTMEMQLAALRSQAEGFARDADEIRQLRAQNAQFLEQKSVAVTQIQESEKKLQVLLAERDAFQRQKDEAVAARMEAQKQVELGRQKMEDMQQRMQDWELQKAESLKAATASIFEVGGKLSSKLLEDHKREAEAAKKEAEAAVKKTSDGLMEQFMIVTKSVAAIQEQNKNDRTRIDTVWRALTSPGSVGHMAEIGLENSLKNLQLEAGRDYITQFTVRSEEAGSLRPDAVLFLPPDSVMVIDSKASKFIIEVEEAVDETGRMEALKRLSGTMNKHLRDLTGKSYDSAIRASYKESGRGDAIGMIYNVMYVPSESSIKHIKQADPEFIQRAQKCNIIVASPASLSALLTMARHTITLARQEANQAAIVSGIQDLMDSMVSVLSHADKVGRGLKSAADNFGQFAGSVNMRMLPRMKKLIGLGMKPSKKELPARLASYEIRLSDDMLTIEGEVEAVEELGVVENFPKKALA